MEGKGTREGVGCRAIVQESIDSREEIANEIAFPGTFFVSLNRKKAYLFPPLGRGIRPLSIN